MVRCPQIHHSGVFAGPGTIIGDSAGPAFAITGQRTIAVLQGLIFEVRVGVGPETPDLADFLAHDDYD